MKGITFISGLFCALAIPIAAQEASISSVDSTSHYYYKIVQPNRPDDLPMGVLYFQKAAARQLNANDTLGAIRSLRLVATGQYHIGEVYASEQSAVRALALIEANSHNDTLIENRLGLYNQLGNAYRTTQNYEMAIDQFEKAYTWARTPRERIALLNNIGIVHKDRGDYEEAKKVLEKAQSLFNGTVPLGTRALILDNLGFVTFKRGEAGALEYLERALTLRKEAELPTGQFASHRNLFEYYLTTDRERALAHADSAYSLATQLQSGSYLEEALSLYALANESPQVVRYKKVTDSLAMQRQLATNKNAFLQYNVSQAQRQTQAAELQSERQKNQKIVLGGILALVLLLGGALFVILRLRHRKATLQQVFATEAEISKKLHDEVANDLYRILAQWQQPSQLSVPPIEALDAVYQKTRNLSRDLGDVPTAQFHIVLGSLLESYRGPATKILTRNLQQINWDAYDGLQKKTIYRVLQELMTNMRKHSNARLVVVSFTEEGKKLRINYSDNGIGTALSRKNGLQNAENRMEAIGGRITFESKPGGGFKATLLV